MEDTIAYERRVCERSRQYFSFLHITFLLVVKKDL